MSVDEQRLRQSLHARGDGGFADRRRSRRSLRRRQSKTVAELLGADETALLMNYFPHLQMTNRSS